MKLDIHSIVGENCIAVADGEQVYNLIHPDLMAGRPVVLDFAGVNVFVSTFFNPAIGHLLEHLTKEQLSHLLTFDNLNPVGRDTINRVIENSDRYYHDEAYRKALDEIVSEQADPV